MLSLSMRTWYICDLVHGCGNSRKDQQDIDYSTDTESRTPRVALGAGKVLQTFMARGAKQGMALSNLLGYSARPMASVRMGPAVIAIA